MNIRRGIGLFGGTFDPVHNGHLCVAREALRAMPLARVDFVLAPRPWQKAVATPVEERLAMLEEAVADEPMLGVSLLEVMREGDTYTIDTLKEMRALTGPSTPLVLIIGADQWRNLHTWRDWRAFPEYAHIALCNRAGSDPGAAAPEVLAAFENRRCSPGALSGSPCGGLAQFSIPEHAASSTKIRELFAALPPTEALHRLETWLPVRVARRIARRGLYARPGVLETQLAAQDQRP